MKISRWSTQQAVAPDAPLLWPEAPGNTAIDWQAPPSEGGANEREVDEIISSAPHVARISELNQRIFAATMEPRGATASHDAASDNPRCAPVRRARS